jgi:hypothetical protein
VIWTQAPYEQLSDRYLASWLLWVKGFQLSTQLDHFHANLSCSGNGTRPWGSYMTTTSACYWSTSLAPEALSQQTAWENCNDLAAISPQSKWGALPMVAQQKARYWCKSVPVQGTTMTGDMSNCAMIGADTESRSRALQEQGGNSWDPFVTVALHMKGLVFMLCFCYWGLNQGPCAH